MRIFTIYLREDQLSALPTDRQRSRAIRQAIDLWLAWQGADRCPELIALMECETATIAELRAHIEGCPPCRHLLSELLEGP